MSRIFLLAGAAIAAIVSGSGAAQATACASAGATPVTVGQLMAIAPGAAARFAVDLAAGEGVQVDLTTAGDPAGSDKSDGSGGADAAPTGLAACDSRGSVLAPLPSEVFVKGGSLTAGDDGLHLRFVAPAAGRYVIVADPADGPRELLLRHRAIAPGGTSVIKLDLGGSDFIKVSKTTPRVFAFEAKPGQWVRITANSPSDTVLHLAGAAPGGGYAVLADNDDADGLNPRITTRLVRGGTYYVQLESLASDPDDVTILIEPTQAPPPPPPPLALKAGTTVSGKLASGDDRRIYVLPVIAGHAYRLDLDAAYDAVIEVGMADPIEPDGSDEPGDGFSALRTKDDGTSGKEKLAFTARTTGQVLVQVRAYGIDDGDGGYTLAATDGGN
ncbi:hypothetical protein [Novosphingobium lentum]|uniref:hypothetical protein n=1 Tax=Novosphingobium lentum TaxID=145287 RepID=UPI00082B8FCC|nr:hypothetical protein [Novosphingobium lentum]